MIDDELTKRIKEIYQDNQDRWYNDLKTDMNKAKPAPSPNKPNLTLRNVMLDQNKAKKKMKPKKLITTESTNLNDFFNMNEELDKLEHESEEDERLGIDNDLADIQQQFEELYETMEEYDLLEVLAKVMHDMVKQGNNDFILIKNDDARNLYERYIGIMDQIRNIRHKADTNKKKIESALDKLTAEEKKLLGLG